MSNENDYLNILYKTNFVGGDGVSIQQQDLSAETGEVNQRADIGIDGNIIFHFLSLNDGLWLAYVTPHVTNS